MDRRRFLKITAMTAAASLAQACGSTPAPSEPATQAPAQEATSAPAATMAPETAAATSAPAGEATVKPSKYGEAPMLAELVQAGQLPPVEERLPPDPQVIEPWEEVGQYGGTIRVAIGNVNQLFGDPQAVLGTELILRIGPDYKTIEGGLFESWEFNEDATEQILHMRKGLRWSDGEPFTTADCLFDWEDCKLNEELYPSGPPSAWRVGADRTPLEMEAIDDFTLRLKFADSYPLIILPEAFYPGCQGGGLFAPKHYGMQFHPYYADKEELDAKIKEAGFEKWTELFGDRMRVGSTIPAQIDLPGMTAFIRTADDPDHHTYERNPYYWKVDTAGNQLPYIDKAIIYIISDRELINARLIAGELDFAGRNAQLKNMELYQANLESANLKIYMWDSTYPGRTLIYPNHTAKDPELRELFQNRDVRIALSIAMNRNEINDVVHFGLGEVRQWSMWPTSAYYREGDELHYVEYDPDQANALLDSAGYDQKDADGYRLFPSGKRISWLIEYDPEQGDIAPTLELCVQYWKDIGFEVALKPINRQLLNERFDANELVMTTWEGDISDITWPQNPRAVICGLSNHTWARAWEAWLWSKDQFPEIEEEPPAWLQEQHSDWMQMQVTLDESERLEIASRIWDRYYEYLPCFASVGVPQPVVMKKNLMNFREWGVWGYSTIRAVPIFPEQYFFKQE